MKDFIEVVVVVMGYGILISFSLFDDSGMIGG
jgi:hypothetical protein